MNFEIAHATLEQEHMQKHPEGDDACDVCDSLDTLRYLVYLQNDLDTVQRQFSNSLTIIRNFGEEIEKLTARAEAAETYAWHHRLECHCDICVTLDDTIQITRGERCAN